MDIHQRYNLLMEREKYLDIQLAWQQTPTKEFPLLCHLPLDARHAVIQAVIAGMIKCRRATDEKLRQLGVSVPEY